MKHMCFTMCNGPPENGPPCGTVVWETPQSTPLCNHFIAQTLWKKNGPRWRYLLDTPVIVPIVMKLQADRPENRRKKAMFGH